MKPRKITYIFTSIALFVALSLNAQSDQKNRQDTQTILDKSIKSVEIRLTGMTCAGCASTVSNVLSETPGVTFNEVKFPGDIAVVKYNSKKIYPEDIVKAIEAKTTFTAEILPPHNKKNHK